MPLAVPVPSKATLLPASRGQRARASSRSKSKRPEADSRFTTPRRLTSSERLPPVSTRLRTRSPSTASASIEVGIRSVPSSSS